jgi:cytoskeletal protein RodZ
LTSVEPGQTAPTVPLVEPRPEKQAPVVESVQVRSDELSLQPVSVSKPTRAWVVPVSLLLVGVVGVAVAFVGWPDRRSTPTPAPEDSARAPVVAARPVEPQEVVNVSSSPSAALPIPSARGPETLATASQSTLVPAPPTSAPGVLQPANSATASPKPSATTKKSLTKGKDVLDQY